MKKIIAITISLLIVTTAAFAGNITADSSWEDIKADKTLKVVYPLIATENGAYATYENFHIEGNTLKSGKTWKKETAWKRVGKDEARVAVETVLQPLETPVEYMANICVDCKFDKDGDRLISGRFEKIQGSHSKTARASVYKLVSNEKKSDRFLFSKEFTIPVK